MCKMCNFKDGDGVAVRRKHKSAGVLGDISMLVYLFPSEDEVDNDGSRGELDITIDLDDKTLIHGTLLLRYCPFCGRKF